MTHQSIIANYPAFMKLIKGKCAKLESDIDSLLLKEVRLSDSHVEGLVKDVLIKIVMASREYISENTFTAMMRELSSHLPDFRAMPRDRFEETKSGAKPMSDDRSGELHLTLIAMQ